MWQHFFDLCKKDSVCRGHHLPQHHVFMKSVLFTYPYIYYPVVSKLIRLKVALSSNGKECIHFKFINYYYTHIPKIYILRNTLSIFPDHDRIFNEHALSTFKSIFKYFDVLLRSVQLSLILAPFIATLPLIVFFQSGRLLWFKYFTKGLFLLDGGPTWIKLGQWASTRPDLFPDEWIQQLTILHHHAPEHSIDWTRQVIREDFGKEIHEIFEVFDTNPIGSGSIAQVYKAKLKSNGEWVAVKISHPHIIDRLQLDLSLLSLVANLIHQFIPEAHWIHLPDEVKQFSKVMLLQANLLNEVYNLIKFRSNFDHPSLSQFISFPAPIYPYVSKRCLTQSYIEGLSMKEFLSLDPKIPGNSWLIGMNKMIVGLGFKAFLKMMLLDNFIHADLHPGNLFVVFNKLNDKDEVKSKGKLFRLKQESHASSLIKEMSKVKILSLFLKRIFYIEGDDDPSSITSIFTSFSPSNAIANNQLEPLNLTKLPSLYDSSSEAEHIRKLVSSGHIIPKIVFLDVGLVNQLSKRRFENFLELFKTIIIWRDGYKAGKLLIQRAPGSLYYNGCSEFDSPSLLPHHHESSQHNIIFKWVNRLKNQVFFNNDNKLNDEMEDDSWKYMNPDIVNPEGFCSETQHIVRNFFTSHPPLSKASSSDSLSSATNGISILVPTLPLEKYHITPILIKVLGLVRTHHIRLDDHYTNLIMSMVFVEGLGRRLCPGLDLLPFLRQAAIHYFLRT